MPYIFGALLIANVALFGFLWFNPNQTDASVERVQSELTKPMKVVNSSHEIPPPIGQK